MFADQSCTVYIGNLDERVTDRVLYDILIQAGRVVDLYIPRDKETDRSKGYAFAQYETEEIANYAVRLFTGLVTIYNRTLRFAISGQDKASSSTPASLGANENVERSNHSVRSSHRSWISHPANYSQGSSGVARQNSGHRSDFNGNAYGYSQRVLGATLGSIMHTRTSHYDSRGPITHPRC